MMPAAIRYEISIAYGLGKPLILFREKGVRFDGFVLNYGTHLTFDRSAIYSPMSIERLVSAIHEFRVFLENTTELSLALRTPPAAPVAENSSKAPAKSYTRSTKIFGETSGIAPDPHLCFVLMPFTATLQPVYE